MVVKVSVKPNIDRIREKYKRAGKDLSNIVPAHKKVAIYLDQWVQRNFRDKGSNLGSDKWPDYARGGRAIPDLFFNEDQPPPGSWEFVQVLGDGLMDYWVDKSAMLMQDTGRLKFSFLPFATQRNAGIGSELEYAEYHNNRKDKWKRRLLPETNEVHDKLHEILERHAKRSLGIRTQ